MVASWLLSAGLKIELLNKSIMGPSFLDFIFDTFDCLASWQILFLSCPSLFPCTQLFLFLLYREESSKGLFSQKVVVLSWKPQVWRCKQWRFLWTEWESGGSEEPYVSLEWSASSAVGFDGWPLPQLLTQEFGGLCWKLGMSTLCMVICRRREATSLKSETTLPIRGAE